jgi:hypothetical protein
MKVKSFDRPTARVVGNAIESAVQGVAKEFGIIIQRVSGRYDEKLYTLKLECAVMSNGQPTSRAAEDFKRWATLYGLKPSDLHKQIVFLGEHYKVVGLKPKSRRYPILAERADGKRFKLPVSAVNPKAENPDTIY